MKNKTSHILFCLMVLASGCGQIQSEFETETRTLTVFAASSLTDAFGEIAAVFMAQHPGVEVKLNFSGSSQLAAQLREGVIADVFASANPTQMDVVTGMGLVEPGGGTQFVSNLLTMVVPKDNPAELRSLSDLARSGIKLLLAVEGVPVRDYTDRMVSALSIEFQMAFYRNVVSEEDNVRQVLAKIALGEADAGLVYLSDVSPDIGDLVQQIEIPVDVNVIASYSIASLSEGHHPELAQEFIAFVLSPAGEEILSRWGFGPRDLSESAPNQSQRGEIHARY